MSMQPEKRLFHARRLESRGVLGQPPKTPLDELTDETIELPRLPKETIKVYAISAISKEEASLAQPIAKEEASRSLSQPKRTARQSWLNDSWLIATMLISYITSIASFWYFFQNHQIILYGDAYAHMLITRRVFDNVTPGLAQLGAVWLPLPHVVMLPFIWNNYLWYTGLAGTIPSMICYQIATVYIFLSARRLTQNSRASFIGTLLFILNPNVLYLQTTALSEIVLIATLTAASYYFLAWVQEDKLNYLILSGFATCLATLSRYDGWFLLCDNVYFNRAHRATQKAAPNTDRRKSYLFRCHRWIGRHLMA